jgi:hypothetical protein
MSTFGRAVFISLLLAAPHVSAQDTKKTEGPCSPIVENQGGTTNVKIECGLNLSPRELARRNISAMLQSLRSLGYTQAYYFMPSLERFAKAPTPANWSLVEAELQRTQKALQTTIDASITYFGTIKFGNLQGAQLAQLLADRAILLSGIGDAARSVQRNSADLAALNQVHLVTSTQIVPPQDLPTWMTQYRTLMSQLTKKIEDLERSLDALELAKDETTKK